MVCSGKPSSVCQARANHPEFVAAPGRERESTGTSKPTNRHRKKSQIIGLGTLAIQALQGLGKTKAKGARDRIILGRTSGHTSIEL
jgi:hypothetical protein